MRIILYWSLYCVPVFRETAKSSQQLQNSRVVVFFLGFRVSGLESGVRIM